MYMVISMPKRMSIASGVSHFMVGLLLRVRAYDLVGFDHPPVRGGPIGDDHERELMIFMSRRRDWRG
jgi:hypothetical protein